MVALLDAGVDAYKIRQRDLSDYEKYQIISWLHRRKYIDLHSVHATPNKPCLEKRELKLSSKINKLTQRRKTIVEIDAGETYGRHLTRNEILEKRKENNE